MRLKRNIAISESGFLFDPNTGDSYSLNASGREIINLINQKKDLSEIENIIVSRYDVSNQDFERYIEDFSQMLKRFNLLEDEAE